MKLTKTNSLLLGVCLSLASPLMMADGFNSAQIETLRKQGKAQQAYDLAITFRNEYEGDPVFDFYYGIAALDAGKLSEGVLALERAALTTKPNTLVNTRSRLELARGYFLLKEDTRSRQEFELVLATKPPAEVVNNVKKFLRIIRLRESEYRSTASAYVEVALGHDTNINGAPDIASFTSPLFVGASIQLGDNSIEDDDDYLTVTTGGKLVHPFEPGKQLILGADVQARFNSTDDDFETETWNVYAGVKWRVEDMTFGVAGQVQEFELGDVDNRSLVSLSADMTKRLNKQTNWSSQIQIAQIAYPGSDFRDSTLYTLGTGLSHQYAKKWRPTVFGGAYLGREVANTDDNTSRAIAQRNFGGVRIALQVIPTSNLSVSTALSVENSHYEGENLLLGVTRNDYLYQASLSSRYLLDDNWSLGGGIYYTRNDSNSVLNDYDRTRVEVSTRYTF